MRYLLTVSPLFFAAVFCAAVPPVSAQVKTQLPEVMEAVVKTDAGSARPTAPKPKPKTIDVTGGPAPIWIWAKDSSTPQKCWLRREFESDAVSAAMIATCDNGMQVYLNGKRVLSSTQWQSPVRASVTKHLKRGTNEIRVAATNEGSLAGFAMKLAMQHSGARMSYLISDKSWKASLSEDFSDVVETTTHGKMGVGPWGNVFSRSAGPALVSRVPRNVFQVLPGFQVEKLYDVDKGQEGSWVCMTFDNQGRIIASDQGGKGLFRITPPAVGDKQSTPTKVEKLDISISSAQGMLYAFDALYCSCNGGPGSGLYKLTDTDGDDQFDKVDRLKSFQGGGEHGPHALRLSPDGKSIYVIAGNHTNPPGKFDSSRVPANWGEDLLLPRQWDARGHARGKLAPGGWIAKTDPAGATWEIVSIGYRNPYDMDFSPEGELFAYDADMEWDMGSPWYRPTRICHAVSGSEFGWRSGTGKWPAYYVDSLPQVVDIGPGSPVGVAFGTGAKFPLKYQRALYCCDWTFGTMYAVHLKPSGSSFVGEREEFLSRTPLPLTDVEIGPDGAMYFTMGGRGTQSGLFRVTYTGTVPPAAESGDPVAAGLRQLRHSLEEHHRSGRSSADVAMLWPHLNHADRHIRYAARVALEHADPQLWEDRVLTESDPQTLITASVALARQGRKESQRAITEKLAGIDFSSLSESQQLDLVRALSLVFIRLGGPDAATAAALAKTFDTRYPARSAALNRELVQLLVYLNSSTVIDRTLKLLAAEDGDSAYDWTEVLARNGGYGGTIAKMLANMPDLNKAQYAFALRNMKYGWTLEQRKAYLAYYQQASGKSGGASYQGFLQNAQKDWLAQASETERKALAGQISQNAPKEAELPRPLGPGKEWTAAELLELAGNGVSGRDYEKGRRAYAAARCISCHRFGGEGGSTGPDLTSVAGRFSYRDLLESTVVPSKVISDQYRATIIETKKGMIITGRLLGEADGRLTVLTDPVDITQIREIARSDVEEMTPSPTSLMPEKLLHPLSRDEVLDLIAYLMSRGNPDDPVFK